MSPLMHATTKKIRELVRLDLDALTRLRDEIRSKVQLASLEERSTWADLEKQFDQLEERCGSPGDHVVDTMLQNAAELRSAFRDFKKRVLSELGTDPDIPSIR